jgi:hypothetical protein
MASSTSAEVKSKFSGYLIKLVMAINAREASWTRGITARPQGGRWRADRNTLGVIRSSQNACRPTCSRTSQRSAAKRPVRTV